MHLMSLTHRRLPLLPPPPSAVPSAAPVSAPVAHANAFDEFDTPQQAPAASQAAPSNSLFDQLNRSVNAFANGATFGGADHLAAAGNAIFGVGSQAPDFASRYHENMAALAHDQEQMPPAARAIIGLAGGVASPVARAVVGGADLAMNGGRALAGLIPGAASVGEAVPGFVGAVGRGVGQGAALGATQGALEGDVSPADRLTNAEHGAAMGGALGVAAPTLIAAGRGLDDVVQGARAAYTDAGTSGIAKQIIDEAAGGPLSVEAAALPSVQLTLPQAANSRATGQLAATVANKVPDPPMMATTEKRHHARADQRASHRLIHGFAGCAAGDELF